MERRGRVGRAVAVGGVLAVLLSAAGLTLAYFSGALTTHRGTLPATVVLAVACEGEDGALVTPVVATVDTATGAIDAHDPLAAVTIPGTTYDRLRDAYAFGGGPAVAAAAAQLTGAGDPAYVLLDAATWATAADAAGGVRIDSPRNVDVFTGETLYVFPAGRQVLSVPDACEYLKGAAYLADNERERVAEEFAAALGAAVAIVDPGGTGVSTDLSAEAFENLQRRLW